MKPLPPRPGPKPPLAATLPPPGESQDDPAAVRDEADQAALKAARMPLLAPPKRFPSRVPTLHGFETDEPPTRPEIKVEAEDPVSVPASVDRATGKAVRLVLGKLLPYLLTVGLSSAGVAAVRLWSLADRLDATVKRVDLLDGQVTESRKRELAWQTYDRAATKWERCWARQVDDALERLTPDADAMGSARKPKPWVDGCGERPEAP